MNGLLNVICNHSFHCECSQRWSEVRANCSVCAMCDKVNYQTSFSNDQPYQIGISCSSCELNENLWMCLICGYIGCSRYTNKHSYVRKGDFYDLRNFSCLTTQKINLFSGALQVNWPFICASIRVLLYMGLH